VFEIARHANEELYWVEVASTEGSDFSKTLAPNGDQAADPGPASRGRTMTRLPSILFRLAQFLTRRSERLDHRSIDQSIRRLRRRILAKGGA
jgi:hypothetical protein